MTKNCIYESDSAGSCLRLDSSSSFMAPERSTGVNTDITISILVNAHVSAGISLLLSTRGREQNVGQTGVRPLNEAEWMLIQAADAWKALDNHTRRKQKAFCVHVSSCSLTSFW